MEPDEDVLSNSTSLPHTACAMENLSMGIERSVSLLTCPRRGMSVVDWFWRMHRTSSSSQFVSLTHFLPSQTLNPSTAKK